METVVLEALGDVNSFDAGGFRIGTDVIGDAGAVGLAERVTTVGNAEGLVEVKMADVGADLAW